MVDRYTKVVLTIIAVSLVSIAARESVPAADAQRYGQQVWIAGISVGAAKCIRGHVSLWGSQNDAGECIGAW